jgi:hypothetical protein
MERTAVLGWLQGLFRRNVLSDVPEDMSACLSCGVLQCSDERWVNCSHRLAEAAALRALRQSQGKRSVRLDPDDPVVPASNEVE